MYHAERLPAKEVLWPLADILRRRFFPRQDVYAEQAADGRYRCIRQPLRTEQVVAHLEGTITLGTYLLDADDRARFLVFDADNAGEWQTLLGIAAQLDSTEPICYREASRRGGHLWLFFHRPVFGAVARRYGTGILEAFGAEEIELYPKQEQLAGGVGSLIRLPFGRHRKSGKRYGFLAADGRPLAPTLREQILLLAAPRTIPNRLFVVPIRLPCAIPSSISRFCAQRSAHGATFRKTEGRDQRTGLCGSIRGTGGPGHRPMSVS